MPSLADRRTRRDTGNAASLSVSRRVALAGHSCGHDREPRGMDQSPFVTRVRHSPCFSVLPLRPTARPVCHRTRSISRDVHTFMNQPVVDEETIMIASEPVQVQNREHQAETSTIAPHHQPHLDTALPTVEMTAPPLTPPPRMLAAAQQPNSVWETLHRSSVGSLVLLQGGGPELSQSGRHRERQGNQQKDQQGTRKSKGRGAVKQDELPPYAP